MPDDLTVEERLIRKLQLLSVITLSARGWQLLQMEIAAGGYVGLRIEPGGRHPTEDRLATLTEADRVHVELQPAFYDAVNRVDIRGDMPRQLAACYRSMAATLESMADAVEQRPVDTSSSYEPRAYILREPGTGKLLAQKLLRHEASQVAYAFRDVTNEQPILTVEPLENWPEVRAELDGYLKYAGIDPANWPPPVGFDVD